VVKILTQENQVIHTPTGLRPIFDHKESWLDWWNSTISVEDAIWWLGIVLFVFFISGCINSWKKLK
jgi:hypothetical protein